ncbi:hypothetical protein SLA2020_020870 [Shorea laevis]
MGLCIESVGSRAEHAQQLEGRRVLSESTETLSSSLDEEGSQFAAVSNTCPPQNMQLSLPSPQLVSPKAASLSAKVTVEKPPETNSHLQSLRFGPIALRPSSHSHKGGENNEQNAGLNVDFTEAGSLLSDQFQTQLNLGDEPTKGKKRSRADESWGGEFKRPKLQDFGGFEPLCSPANYRQLFHMEDRNLTLNNSLFSLQMWRNLSWCKEFVGKYNLKPCIVRFELILILDLH